MWNVDLKLCLKAVPKQNLNSNQQAESFVRSQDQTYLNHLKIDL